MAWFGPKGVATMAFALFVLGSAAPEGERIANIAALAVLDLDSCARPHRPRGCAVDRPPESAKRGDAWGPNPGSRLLTAPLAGGAGKLQLGASMHFSVRGSAVIARPAPQLFSLCRWSPPVRCRRLDEVVGGVTEPSCRALPRPAAGASSPLPAGPACRRPRPAAALPRHPTSPHRRPRPASRPRPCPGCRSQAAPPLRRPRRPLRARPQRAARRRQRGATAADGGRKATAGGSSGSGRTPRRSEQRPRVRRMRRPAPMTRPPRRRMRPSPARRSRRTQPTSRITRVRRPRRSPACSSRTSPRWGSWPPQGALAVRRMARR